MRRVSCSAPCRASQDDDDDETKRLRRILYFSTSQVVGSVPLVSDIFDTAVQYILTGEKKQVFSDSLFPGLTSIRKAVTSDTMEKAVKNLAEGVGMYMGLPISGAKQVVKAVQDKSVDPLLGRR